MKRIWLYLLMKMKCQRGEVADDIDASEIQDGMFTADIDDEGYVPPSDDDDDKDDKDAQDDGDDDQSGDDDKDADDKDNKPDKLTELELELQKANKEISRLGYALRKGETKKETKDDKETPFTKTQLMQLYKEHSDNPEVVFQIMEEMSKQGKVDAQVAAEKGIDIKTKKSNMENYIDNVYPDARQEGTEMYEGVQKTIEWAHLDGHPFANELALGLLTLKNLPENIKKIKEDAKAEALKLSDTDLSKKAEAARKKAIQQNKLNKSGNSDDAAKTVTLTAKEMDTAKRLGITSKAQLHKYARMLGNKSETQHAEA